MNRINIWITPDGTELHSMEMQNNHWNSVHLVNNNEFGINNAPPKRGKRSPLL